MIVPVRVLAESSESSKRFANPKSVIFATPSSMQLHLQCNSAIKFLLFGLVDNPHAPMAQDPFDLIASNHFWHRGLFVILILIRSGLWRLVSASSIWPRDRRGIVTRCPLQYGIAGILRTPQRRTMYNGTRQF